MKIAIVKLSAMGDIIHAMAALQFIKEHYPKSEIDWIVEKSFMAVLQNNPDIHAVLPVQLKLLKEDKLKIFSEMKRVLGYAVNHYDIVIDAQGLIKSALTAKFLKGKEVWGFSRTSIREGVASFFYDNTVEISYAANTIDRNMKVISEPLNFQITPEQVMNKKPFLYYKDEDTVIYDYFSSNEKNIVFVIGSTWESRNYPKEGFAKVATGIKGNVLLTWGSDKEKEWAEWIAKHTSNAKVLPRLNLNTLKALIAKADLVIGNDTGPTHMAWGLNIPSITLFGPTPVSRVYQTPINFVIKSDSEVDPYKLDKNDFSIRNIDSGEIITMAERLLND
jgi:heptosyltransferase-1